MAKIFEEFTYGNIKVSLLEDRGVAEFKGDDNTRVYFSIFLDDVELVVVEDNGWMIEGLFEDLSRVDGNLSLKVAGQFIDIDDIKFIGRFG